MKKRVIDTDFIAKYGWQKNFSEELSEELFAFGYINSYLEAANILVDNRIPDLLIFPIMFCYRQYLELVLKNICYKNMKDNEYRLFIKKSSHNLINIWKKSKNFLKDKPEEQLNFIEKIVEFFSEKDPNSYSFRFRCDKQNRIYIKEDFLINTEMLKKDVEKVDLYLRNTYDKDEYEF